jgi:hypothetical protein
LIESALQASERAHAEGKGRQAVQEVLWLLETVSTAFRSDEILNGSIQGRYFNKINRRRKSSSLFYSEWWQNGAPFRIKLRTLM